ncbi:MAG TPA: redoxin domain-containing protein [Campylobacterales bacterium]|nr:redoxin domain-containing protein [Campylobacterales bacterium]
MRTFLSIILILGAAFAAPINLCEKKIVTSENTYVFERGKVHVLMFGADWCPPCVASKELTKETKDIFGVDITYINTDKINTANFAYLGLKKSIPLILVTDKSGAVVKRFESKPNKKVFFELIKRALEGRLENGTPPIEERVDLWKKSRFDK